MRIISWPNTDPAHLLSTLSPERYRSGPKTRYEASGPELPRWSFHPLEIMSFSCRTQIRTTSNKTLLSIHRLCHAGGSLLDVRRRCSRGYEENQLRRISVPARGHTSGDLALSPVHT